MAQTSDLSFLRHLNDKYKFYFSGEWHSHTDYKNRYELLTTLHKSNNVRVLILEAFKEYEFDFNRFINTGDTDTYFLKNLHRAARMNKPAEFDEHLKKIKSYNESVKDSANRISIICADVNPSLSYGIFKLSLIYSDGYTDNSEVKKIIKRARRIGLWGRRKPTRRQIRIVYKLKSSLDNHTKDWQDLYAAWFPMAKRAVNSLYRNAKVYEVHRKIPDTAREQIMYENILEASNDYPNVSFYGNFGQMHTLQNCNPSQIIPNQIGITTSFASLLNQTPGLQGKICSMPYYYLGMPATTPSSKKFYEKNFLTDEERKRFKEELGTRDHLYVPADLLEKKEELRGIFQYLIISR